MYIKKSEVTIDDIKKIPTPFLTAEQISSLCGIHPESIRCISQEDFKKFGENKRLPFHVFQVGNKTKIEKSGFIEWYEKQFAY